GLAQAVDAGTEAVARAAETVAEAEADDLVAVVVAAGVRVECAVGDSSAVAGIQVIDDPAARHPNAAGAPDAGRVHRHDAAVVLEVEHARPPDRGLNLRAVVEGHVPVAEWRMEAAEPQRQLVAEHVAD